MKRVSDLVFLTSLANWLISSKPPAVGYYGAGYAFLAPGFSSYLSSFLSLNYSSGLTSTPSLISFLDVA